MKISIKKTMKRLIAALICFTIFCSLTGCSLGEQNKEVIDENFYCEVIDENNIAIGNVKTYPKDGAVFFPEQIKGYTVSKIGFPSGMGFGGNGYLSANKEGEPNIQRCYFPHTIKEVKYDYMKPPPELKVFYCGEVIDLAGFESGSRGCEIYLPAEKYELFKVIHDERYTFDSILLKANISYHLNYDEDNYYYVDYYENGEKILYIPPIPQRDGYTFGGWFKEAECINQWDFDTDTVQISEETQEIQLYAKWMAEQ